LWNSKLESYDDGYFESYIAKYKINKISIAILLRDVVAVAYLAGENFYGMGRKAGVFEVPFND